MPGELAGKVALITGAGGSGCGSAIARRFAREGASVIVLDNHERRARAVAAEIEADLKTRATPCIVDITDRPALDKALDQAVADVGPIDILVNNAAINVQGSIFDYSPDDFDRVLATDLTACWYLVRQTIGSMRARGGGAIVNISSVAAYIGGGGMEAPYAASKAALHDLTRSVAIEGGPYGIRCNAIALGMIRTLFVERSMELFRPHIELTPLRRLGTTDEVAEAALFLASARSSFVTGEILNLSGGYVLGQ